MPSSSQLGKLATASPPASPHRLPDRVIVSVSGVGAFFLAREYVQGNRKQAMLARQRANFQLEQELRELRELRQQLKHRQHSSTETRQS